MSTDRESQTRLQRSNILFAFALAVLLYYVYQLRAELTLIYVSALVAVVLQPVAKSIMRIRIGQWHPGIGLSVIVLVLALLASITLFAVFAVPPVFDGLKNFFSQLPSHAPKLLHRIQSLPLMRRLNVNALNAKVQDFAASFATHAVKDAGNVLHSLFALIISLLLAIYFMIEGERTYSWALTLVSIRHRNRLDRALTRAKFRMGKWLLGQAALMLILGVSSTIVFVLLHVPYPYTLGALMGLFNIIPVVGAMITVPLAILIAATHSWSSALGVIIFYAIYSQLENSILTPRIMQSRVNLPGVAILIALVIGSSLAGFAGAAVAVPTAVLLAVLVEEYVIAGEYHGAIVSSTGAIPEE